MQSFTGTEYLKIDIASNFGLDKMDWDERIHWVDENIDTLETNITHAEEPALFFAGVQALRSTQRGEPVGYPISLDASSSGLQILAALVGCRKSALLCGLISTGHREAAYKTIYKEMCRRAGTDTVLTYAAVKQAIMTALYSSTAEPKRAFGTGDMLRIFYETLQDMIPGAWQLNLDLQTLWQPYALKHAWVLPDNFNVEIKVLDRAQVPFTFLGQSMTAEININRGTREGRSISPNIVHSIDGLVVREMLRRCKFDPARIREIVDLMGRKKLGKRQKTTDDMIVVKLVELYRLSGFLSARILDHINEDNAGLVDLEIVHQLIRTLPEKPFSILSIHDCFRCHPRYGNDLRRQYNQIMSEISASNMLQFIATQILGKEVTINKMEDISADVREADYAIC